MKRLTDLLEGLYPARDVLKVMHLAAQQASVAGCERDVRKAKVNLELAIDARDKALAAIRTDETPPRPLPRFLTIGYVEGDD